VGTLTRPVVLLASLPVAIVLGAWPATIAAAIGILAEGGQWLQIRFAPSPTWDETALASRIAVLPVELRRRLESVGHQVDTAVLLLAAIEDDPARWPIAATSIPTMNNGEGGVVSGTCWTVIAGEAALAASQQPERAGSVDTHLLASIAALLPHSLASNAFSAGTGSRPPSTAGGFTTTQIYDLIRRAITQPGAELLLSRMELVTRRNGPTPHQLLDDDRWRALGAPVSRGDDHASG
jgi:hypothetical protein